MKTRPSRWTALMAVLLMAACQRGLRIPGPLGTLTDQHGAYLDATRTEPTPRHTPEEESSPTDPVQGRQVAAGAAALVGQERLIVDGSAFRYDCSGMVAAAYARAGIVLGGGSRDLHARASSAGLLHERHRPHPGDIAFFDNTYDRDRDGRRDDELTHVGVVESVGEDGTITVVHLGSRGVGRIQMNLARPDDQAVNSVLRSASSRDGGPVLAGQLWRDFGSLWKLAP